MTPRQIAQDVAELAADRIGAEIKSHTEWMRNHPYVAWKFHQTMTVSLPSWRWLARFHHARLATKAKALWMASEDADRCRLAEAQSKARSS